MSQEINPVLDIRTEEDFVKYVLEESQNRPVVVDFWAPWCGPCRTLGPVLEDLARKAEGRWVLAKVNVDELTFVAEKYRIQSIPAVKAIKDGKQISEFVGALPPARILKWLDGFIGGPAEEAVKQGQQKEAINDLVGARHCYKEALEHKPMFPPAVIGLARIDLLENKREDGLRRINKLVVVEDEKLEQEIAQLKFQLSEDPSTKSDIAALLAEVSSHPDDLELQLQLGHAYASKQKYEEAFETFLGVIKKNHTEEGEKAKEAMVQLFTVLGMRHELTKRFRSALSTELFQ